VTVIQTNARVIENEEVIPGHRVLVCSAPEIARLAAPGHFLNVLASGTYESILRKPFSIFQADPAAGTISMLYAVVGATTLGMARKEPGDFLDLIGPLGGNVFSPDPRDDILHILVGGGYGVPPLVFLAERLRLERPDARILFIVGARRKDLLLCEAELGVIGVECFPATEDGSHGTQGRVTDVLVQHLKHHSVVYCCGPTPMMRAVGDLCIKAGVPCQVSVEVPMPCGVGVCMGCVLDLTDGKRVRSCTEGPVFEAAEVIRK
jgi:dihydroorotate dehydrogenase electron transfer subunit